MQHLHVAATKLHESCTGLKITMHRSYFPIEVGQKFSYCISTYSYGKIESMHSNFRNIVERRSNSSVHGSPHHGSVEQNCISSMEEYG